MASLASATGYEGYNLPPNFDKNGIRGAIDHIEDLEVKEHGGVIRYLRRKARVINLPAWDFTTLYIALVDAGIPQVPSTLEAEGFGMLQLTDRDAKIVNNDPSTVDVVLTYKHILDGENQEIGISAASSVIYGVMKCSIKEKKTNVFSLWENGHPDEDETIALIYTYPNTDAKHAGQTITQGGEITVQVPEKNYKFGAYLDTDNPDGFADSLIGKLNEFTWKGEPPRTWMVTEVGYQAVYPGRYKFEFELQNDPDTWDPTAVFIDDATKRPPPDLEFGVGIVTVRAIPHVNFDQIFLGLTDGGGLIIPNPIFN